ncbi:valine--tRNA ligase [Candidatus Pacearchaeota archaeon]|nr:valine--tRNA ligase [Candidatus Pacearchaeota archaeon]
MPELNSAEIEKKWRDFWEKEKIFAYNPKSKKRVYAVDTPPPTVSGNMHLGHAFSYSQQDFIVRYKRMSGNEVFYPFGTDDNGLPTERLVERLKGVKSKEMTRAAFIELCLKTLKEITPDFVQDWKDLGVSADYEMYYSTIDKHAQTLSQKSFFELYKKARIYEEAFPTLFCPECQTPIAQAELEDLEKDTFFTTLKFMCGKEVLPIATTRPELLGACVAVFVNHQDKRYSRLVGKKAKVPIFEHEVPIIADDSAKMDKGTGVLMICSYGDKYDVDAIKRHRLQPNVVLTSKGKVSASPYSGMQIKDARKAILKDLKEKGLIIEQKQIKHIVNVHDKCGTPIEFLPVSQWFIKILDNKEMLIKEAKKISWKPEFMFKRYENWVNGLEWDWSISRERHFGIPIPIWHCKDCDEFILPDERELPVDPLEKEKKCPKCKNVAEPESKVLDTWATSSLTPEIAASLTTGVKIPYALRPQAHDIIRTWAFYTIVKSLYHEKKLPWETIAISGNVSLGGEKMSKSKGNTIEPKDVLNKFGADALRYWASSSKLGEDLDYQEKDLVTGKKLVTKLLNAANFVFMNISGSLPVKKVKLHESDRLFLLQLNSLIKKVTDAFDDCDYARARLETDQFFWKVFADNYLEIVKNRVYQGNEDEKASAAYTLYQAFLAVLKLYAPIVPYITEEIFQTHFRKYEGEKSVHLSEWPKLLKIATLKSDSETWQHMLDIVAFVRGKKSEAKKSMKAEILLSLPKAEQKILASVMSDLKAVCNFKGVKEGEMKVEFV